MCLDSSVAASAEPAGHDRVFWYQSPGLANFVDSAYSSPRQQVLERRAIEIVAILITLFIRYFRF